MDGQQFDELTRALATGRSRRAVLRSLLGGVGAGALALLGGPAHAAPQLKRNGRRCKSSSQCASGYCDPATQQCMTCKPLTACPFGQNCGSVPDGCDGMVSCGSCTDPETCGGGGTAGVCGCTGRTSCTPEECGDVDDGCGGLLSCPPCVVDCAIAPEGTHCGSVETGNLGSICWQGSCYNGCLAGGYVPYLTPCTPDINGCDGFNGSVVRCHDARFDQNNCGFFGNVCAEGTICCDSLCRSSDPNRCGTCSTTCLSGRCCGQTCC